MSYLEAEVVEVKAIKKYFSEKIACTSGYLPDD